MADDVHQQASRLAYGAPLVVAGTLVRQAHHNSFAGTNTERLWTRQEREDAEATLLSPGATVSQGAGHRGVLEAPDPYRTCFERDLDRIQHSKAYRRLAGKCQVFIAADSVDDHLRNRLTHVIEVAQIARGISVVLGLNPSLTAAAASGHDVGHGPFGHAAETAFGKYLPAGVFDHAVWGADVTATGWNLCRETLDAIRCHSWKLDAPSTPEGEVVSWADRIGYVAHDAADAISVGLLTPNDLPREVTDFAGVRQSDQIKAFINAMVAATAATGLVGMTEDGAKVLDAFRRFNYERIYTRPEAELQSTRAVRMLSALVEHYAREPRLLIEADGDLFSDGIVPDPTSEGAYVAAVTRVAGMTDRYAIRVAREELGFTDRDIPLGA